ncbi:hypothetical protein PG997_006939 [Apiospora hydei]|uniref:Uncharacterized protein n=1 Tax=Apiospora hydei TaxID=1337664 RepID=A0ABR1WS94_9PEZI
MEQQLRRDGPVLLLAPYTPGAATTDVAVTGYLGGWGFYSPGLVCPSGSTSACTKTADNPTDGGFTFQFPLTAGETAVGCCPASYSCALDASGRNTCLRTVRSTFYGVVSCGGTAPPGTVAGTWYATSTTYHNIYAPLIQINWRAEDRPATSTNTAVATATTPGSTNPAAPTTSSPSDDPAHSGLSSGAYAGIGIGAALGGLMLLGGAVGGCMLLRRRRRKTQDGSGGGSEPKGPTTNQDAWQQQQQEQRPASNIYEVSESGHTRETHELFTPTPDGGSTLVERQQRMEY